MFFDGIWKVVAVVAAVIGVAVAIGVTAVVIDEIITRAKVREIAKEKGMLNDLIVDRINRENNTITLSELNNRNRELKITGTDIANDITEGEVIYV